MNETAMQLIRLGVDHVKKVPVTNFTGTTRNDALRDKFLEVMGTEKFDPMSYEAHKHEVFAIMREIISQTIANGEGAMSAFYNQFVEESYIEWGDKKEFEIENDAYLTVGKISGNNWDLDRQRMDKGAVISVVTDSYYIKIYEFFKRFMTGRMDFAELVSAVDRSVKKFKDDFVAKVFSDGVDGLPESWFYVGSYNESKIETVISNVTASNDGSGIVLTGTKSALNKLQGITIPNLSDAQKEEYSTVGYLRNWKGYTCAELPTLFKANSITDFVFDNSTVYALPVGVKPVKIINEGTPLVKETNDIGDKKDMTKEIATIFNLGGYFIMNRLFGGFKITG
jgi:hypothetical protein